MWKLLCDLQPEEVKLECERANLVVSHQSSQNIIRLSKYIISTGYDPETFYFNTHYQGDKTTPLIGMAARNLKAAHCFSSSKTNVTPVNVVTSSVSTPVKSNIQQKTDESIALLLEQVTKMSADILKLKAHAEHQLNVIQPNQTLSSLAQDRARSIPILDRYSDAGQTWSEDGQTWSDGSSLPSLPFWSSRESVTSTGSSLNASVSSDQENADMIKICL